jgi:hypothetical protein
VLAYAVEGTTWGPRVRARAVLDRLGGVAVGTGVPQPPLEGYPYRRVHWTDPDALEGFELVVGDWSAVAMRPRGVRGIAVTIAGQTLRARVGEPNPPDAEWDAELRPLHPWATASLPNRKVSRETFQAGRRPLLMVLDQTFTPGVLLEQAAMYARGWQVVGLQGWGADRWIAGADLLLTTGGWSQTVQAKAARVPYLAVEMQAADHWTRAHCTLAELPGVLANLEPVHAELADDWAPWLPDHLPEFAEFVGLRSTAWT